jgi:hypothetical protein
MSGWDGGIKTDLTIKPMRTTGDARQEKKKKKNRETGTLKGKKGD